MEQVLGRDDVEWPLFLEHFVQKRDEHCLTFGSVCFLSRLARELEHEVANGLPTERLSYWADTLATAAIEVGEDEASVISAGEASDLHFDVEKSLTVLAGIHHKLSR